MSDIVSRYDAQHCKGRDRRVKLEDMLNEKKDYLKYEKKKGRCPEYVFVDVKEVGDFLQSFELCKNGNLG